MAALVSPKSLALPGVANMGTSHVPLPSQIEALLRAEFWKPTQQFIRAHAPLPSPRLFASMLRRREHHLSPSIRALVFRACYARQPFAFANRIVIVYKEMLTELAVALAALKAPPGRALEVMRTSIFLFSAFARCLRALVAPVERYHLDFRTLKEYSSRILVKSYLSADTGPPRQCASEITRLLASVENRFDSKTLIFDTLRAFRGDQVLIEPSLGVRSAYCGMRFNCLVPHSISSADHRENFDKPQRYELLRKSYGHTIVDLNDKRTISDGLLVPTLAKARHKANATGKREVDNGVYSIGNPVLEGSNAKLVRKTKLHVRDAVEDFRRARYSMPLKLLSNFSVEVSIQLTKPGEIDIAKDHGVIFGIFFEDGNASPSMTGTFTNLYQRLSQSSRNGSMLCLDGCKHALVVVANLFLRKVQVLATLRGATIPTRGTGRHTTLGKFRVGQVADLKLEKNGIVSLKLQYCSSSQELMLWQSVSDKDELLLHENNFNLQYRLGVKVSDPLNLHSRVCVAGCLGQQYKSYNPGEKVVATSSIQLKKFIVDVSPIANTAYEQILNRNFQDMREFYTQLCSSWSKEKLKDSDGVLDYMNKTMDLIASEKQFWVDTDLKREKYTAKLTKTKESNNSRDDGEFNEIGLHNGALIEDIFIRQNVDAITSGMDFKTFLLDKGEDSRSISRFKKAFASIVDVQFGASEKVVDKLMRAFTQCINDTISEHAHDSLRCIDMIEELVRLSYRLHNTFVVRCPSRLVKKRLLRMFNEFLVDLMNADRGVQQVQLWERIEIFVDKTIQRILRDKEGQESETLLRKKWDAAELQLAMAFKLCQHLEEKEMDKFSVFYKQHLANRLLQSKNVDEDIRFEREAIVVFREVLGEQYTQPLAGMVADILHAKRFVGPFGKFVRSGGKIVLPALKKARTRNAKIFGDSSEDKGTRRVEDGAKMWAPASLRTFMQTLGGKNAAKENVADLDAEIAREVELEFDGGGMPYHWPCMRCTFVNAPQAMKCVICAEGVRPNKEQKRAQLVRGKAMTLNWKCPNCTFVSVGGEACFECQTRRPELTADDLARAEQLMKDEAKRKVLDRRVLESEKQVKAAVIIQRNVRMFLAQRHYKEIQATKIMANTQPLDLRGATFEPLVLHRTFWDQFKELHPDLHKISQPAYHCVARFEEYFAKAYGGGGGAMSLSWVHSRGSMVVANAESEKKLSSLQGLALLFCGSVGAPVSFLAVQAALGGPSAGLLKRELHSLVFAKRPLLFRKVGGGKLIGVTDVFTCEEGWRLKQWEAVGLVAVKDVCILCGRGILQLCTKCAAGGPLDGKRLQKTGCVVAVGECGHTFHWCCVQDWLSMNDHCPLGRHKWKEAKH